MNVVVAAGRASAPGARAPTTSPNCQVSAPPARNDRADARDTATRRKSRRLGVPLSFMTPAQSVLTNESLLPEDRPAHGRHADESMIAATTLTAATLYGLMPSDCGGSKRGTDSDAVGDDVILDSVDDLRERLLPLEDRLRIISEDGDLLVKPWSFFKSFLNFAGTGVLMAFSIRASACTAFCAVTSPGAKIRVSRVKTLQNFVFFWQRLRVRRTAPAIITVPDTASTIARIRFIVDDM